MFQRIIVLDGSEGTERAIPIAKGVEVSEQDVVDAARYLAAVQAAYMNMKRKEQSQADSTDNLQEAVQYCQLNFFC